MADHRDVRVGRDRPGRIGAHYLKWQGKLAPSKPISTCATARAMALSAPSSPRKASMTAPPPAAAAGLWGAPAVWSVTSSSIKVMTQASSPNASDLFNSLLSGSLAPRAAGAVALAADRLSGSAAIPSNGRYRQGFGCRPSERSTRVYDTCRVGNDISGCLRRGIDPVQEDQAGHRELT